ncbi:hypothetical protein DL770_006182 [Monosporascus sp. CRB-9-2]|nr:hypothetical protein DL770_006182 [Monosporascus sp. CRB-9-2]
MSPQPPRLARPSAPLAESCEQLWALHEALFQRMSNDAWHTGIQSKRAGTWNLHNALAVDGRDKKLDFFLLTPSRQRGKPAVSIGLGMVSEVGYLHENPEIEAKLLRKGIQPLNEDEFLQVIDLGERSAKGVAAAHILTSLELFRLRELASRGSEVTNGTLQDPRALILAAALTADQEFGGAAQGCSLPEGGLASAPWLKLLSVTVAASFPSEVEAGSLQGTMLRLIRKRFSSLVLIPLDQFDSRKPLAHFGMDSMIVADSRT